MAKSLGLPYQGSKNRIAKQLIAAMPAADTFCDIFCGGGAMTHAAIESGKYSRFRMNDVNPQIADYFLRCVKGEAPEDFRFVSYEEFMRLRDIDMGVALMYSFGGNMRSYFCNKRNTREQIENLRRKRPAENWKRCRRLNGICDPSRIETSALHWRTFLNNIDCPASMVFYADPPYNNADDYYHGRNFKTMEFLDFLSEFPYPVYISEYALPDEYACIWQKDVRSLMKPADNSTIKTEKLFLHKRFLAWHENAMQELKIKNAS